MGLYGNKLGDEGCKKLVGIGSVYGVLVGLMGMFEIGLSRNVVELNVYE